jgi:uncharacterized protein (TIGR02246 family)
MRKLLFVTLMALVFSAPGYAQDNATVQRLADQFAEAFNKNSAAGVGDMYTDEAILIPPEADIRMGRRDIQAFWTQQAKEAENLTVTLLDLKSIGSDAARAVLRSEATTKGPRAQHVTARNVIVLQKVGADWKVSTHTWNYGRPLRRFRDDEGRCDLIGLRRRCVEGIGMTSLSAVPGARIGVQGVVTAITPGGDGATIILGTTTIMNVTGEIDEEAVRPPGSSVHKRRACARRATGIQAAASPFRLPPGGRPAFEARGQRGGILVNLSFGADRD